LITIVAALSYFAMATHSGLSLHHTRVREHHDHVPDTFRDVYRPIYFARYIDWAITTPLLILDLGLLAGLNGASLFVAIVADIIMILTGLFAAYSHTHTQKWGWYAFACIAYLAVIWQLAITGRKFAAAKSANVGRFYTLITGYTLILWTAYPIIWAIADGTRKLSVNSEIIAYAVLDVLAKGVFGAWLLFTHNRLVEGNVALTGFWVHGFSSEGRIRVGDDEEGA
jgi:bacteriorhodopsin